MKRKTFLLGVTMLAILPVAVLAQEAVPLDSDQLSAWSEVVMGLSGLFGALHSREAMPILAVLCNMIVSLLKTSWFQRLVAKILKKREHTELSTAGKIILALAVGVGVTWFVAPASTGFRTLGKGLMLGFAAIGVFDTWKYTLRDPLCRVLFKGPPSPTEVPPAEV